MRASWRWWREFRGGVELERDAGQRLLQRIVQVARETRALGEHGFELELGFVPLGHLHLELRGAFGDFLLERVVRFLEFALRGFEFADERTQRGVFLRNGERPKQRDEQ